MMILLENILMKLWIFYLNLTCEKCKIKAKTISKNTIIEKGVVVESGVHLNAKLVGKYTYINKNCLIDKSTLRIGRFCSIAYDVRIGLGKHPIDWVSTHSFVYKAKYGFVGSDFISEAEGELKTIIGNDVWIGANSTILAGVKVGNGAIIGAHSLVTKDVEPYSIVLGVPAKHYKFRFEKNIREKLNKSEWWNWSDDKIKEKISFFKNTNKFN